jgi:glycosyltransferase involved in cell wall biosynthesis
MRILIINYEFPPIGGGGGVASYLLAKELSKTHEVEVLTGGTRNLPIDEKKDNFLVHRVPLKRDHLQSSKFSFLIRFIPLSIRRGVSLKDKKFDIIHSFFGLPSGFTGMILGKFLKIPHVVTLIGAEIVNPKESFRYEGERASSLLRIIPFKNFFLSNLLSWIVNSATIVTAISQDTKEAAKNFIKTNKEIKVLPLGFEIPPFPKVSKENLGFSEMDFIIVTVCRLVKRKGLHLLLHALKKLNNRNLKLLIIGDGIERKNLENLAHSLGLDEQVIFTGFIDEDKKFQYISISDIFVLPTYHEGFGIVYLEAMACGLPIITTDNGGQRDIIVDNKNGFLVPVGNVDALVEKIVYLLENKEERERMKKNNVEQAMLYHISNVARLYEEIYREALKHSTKGKV